MTSTFQNRLKSNHPVVVLDKDFAELIPIFLDDLKRDVETITTSLAVHDYATIKRTSHAIRGAGGGYGLNYITEVTQSLERAAIAEDRASLQKWLQEFRQYVYTVEIKYE